MEPQTIDRRLWLAELEIQRRAAIVERVTDRYDLPAAQAREMLEACGWCEGCFRGRIERCNSLSYSLAGQSSLRTVMARAGS